MPIDFEFFSDVVKFCQICSHCFSVSPSLLRLCLFLLEKLIDFDTFTKFA